MFSFLSSRTHFLSHPKQINSQWAERIVNLHCPGAKVEKVSLSKVDIGTTTRIHLEVEHNGPLSFPRKWFIKIPSLSFRARLITTLPRLLQMEVLFYQHLPSLIPLRIPKLLFGDKAFFKGTILILEDIQENGGKAGHPQDILTLEEVQILIKDLAKFHGRFWNQRNLIKTYPWLAGSVRNLEDGLGSLVATPLMKKGLFLGREKIPSHLVPHALQYAKKRKKIMDNLYSGPKTIVHHDCHPGNLFWMDQKPGLLDWQLVRLGEGIGDIAYLLATSLEPKMRKKEEKELVKIYQEALKEEGVESSSLENLWERYQAHLVYPFEAMAVTLAIGGMMEESANLELLYRTSQAVLDNDSFSRIL